VTRATLIASVTLAIGGLGPAATTASADRFADQPIVAADASDLDQPAAQAAPAGPSATRVLASLAGVGLLIVGLGLAWRKLGPVGDRSPGAAADRLAARVNLTPKHQVLVLRVGHRLLVVGDSGHGMRTLAEITDGDEAADVLAACGLASADDDPVKAGAFASTLAAAESGDDFPDGDDEPVDRPPEDASLGHDVRSLIERVRGLAGQHEAAGSRGGPA